MFTAVELLTCPLKVLKGAIKLGSGAVWFRKGLVVFQFVISLVLIFGTIVISRQVIFIQNKNIGYDKENLLYIPVEGELANKYDHFKQEALNINGVQSITCVSDNPTYFDNQTNSVDWDGRNPATLISFEHQTVNYDFVKTMKLNIFQGHDFSKDFASDNDGFILNETAVKSIWCKNPVGRFITVNGRRGEIIGVVKDFNYRSVQEEIQPLIFDLNAHRGYDDILLRTQPAKTKEVLAGVEKLCKQLNSAVPFNYSFSDEEYHKL
jgi:putative ABC transport system permease protein